MRRLLITSVWITTFCLTFLGIAFSIAAIMHFINPQSIQEFGSWYSTAGIGISIVATAGALHYFWPNLIFTEKDFQHEIEKVNGIIRDSGRCSRASLDTVEIEYCFQRGFFSFDLFWMGPTFSPKRKLMQRWIDAGNQWLEAKYLWDLVRKRCPVMIRYPAHYEPNDGWSALLQGLAEIAEERTIEIWIQRNDSEGQKVKAIKSVEPSKLYDSDHMIVLIYLAPWENSKIRQVFHIAAT